VHAIGAIRFGLAPSMKPGFPHIAKCAGCPFAMAKNKNEVAYQQCTHLELVLFRIAL
jgi:hypothetical protein